MTKTKTPLLSLDAHGTLASQFTFQKKDSLTMVRVKPTPSDPKTLLQMYQRWEVQDYIAYWQTLTDAQKLVYFRAGAKNHRTPVAEFLKGHLSELPDIVARYRLDTISGNTVMDSSKNAYHGTVFGPSLTDGIIDKALLFDGIDDYVRIPKADGVVNGDISVEAFIMIDPAQTAYDYIISKRHFWAGALYNYNFWVHFNTTPANAALYFEYGDGVGNHYGAGAYHSWTPGIWYHVAATHDGTNVRLYINGALHATRPSAWTMVGGANYYLCIGCRATRNTGWWKGKIDNPIIRNRIETEAEIYLHSQRHYPL